MKGLDISVEINPNLVIIDAEQHKLKLSEICEVFSITANVASVPIIAIIDENNTIDLTKAVDYGLFDCIIKPFNDEQFKLRINAALKYGHAISVIHQHEILETFAATIVTFNHELKQPLTLLNLSVTALKRELQKENIDKAILLSKIVYIETAIKQIKEILESLSSLKSSKMSDYVGGIKMLEFNTKKDNIENI